MPLIDLYAAEGTFPAERKRELAERLTAVTMRAEGLPDPAPRQIEEITAAYLHLLPAADVHTAAEGEARTVRLSITIGAGGLTPENHETLVAETTAIVADVAGDPSQADRTFVIVVEAWDGWGINGTLYRPEDAAKLLAA